MKATGRQLEQAPERRPVGARTAAQTGGARAAVTQAAARSDLLSISVVTPSFNQAEYLGQTLRSVVDQGYGALEYVVVDGGSSDGSADLIREYEPSLAWWVSEPDGGHAPGLNKGFAHTSGEIMGWINSSDVYFPWTLATVSAVFSDLPEVHWLGGLPAQLDPAGRLIAVWPHRQLTRYDLIGEAGSLQQEGVFWRRSLWEAAGARVDEARPYAFDLELWLRFSQLAPFHSVNVPLGGFRYHADRRGDRDGSPYRTEKRALTYSARARLSPADRRRVQMARATANPPGMLARRALTSLGLAASLQQPTVVFDVPQGRWCLR